MSSKNPKPRRDQSDTDLTQTDLASDIMGNNSLQGDDQAKVRNQRHAVPDVKQEADESLIDTFEKADKDVRAQRDLGKGRRHSPMHPYNKDGE